MLTPGRVASRARATERGGGRSAKTTALRQSFNNIRQYMSYKIDRLKKCKRKKRALKSPSCENQPVLMRPHQQPSRGGANYQDKRGSIPSCQSGPGPGNHGTKTRAIARSVALRQRRTPARTRPITNSNATHFGIQLAVNAVYNLTENLRYLLHLHREQQRSIRRQHEETLADALAAEIPGKPKVVRLHAPTQSNGKKPTDIRSRTHSTRERFGKRRRASSISSSQVA